MPRQQAPTSSESHPRGFDALVIALGVVLSLAAFAAARRQEERQAFDRLRRFADDYLQAADVEYRHQLLALESVRAFWYASLQVTRSEFGAFTAPLLEGYPGLESIEWIPLVPDGERPSFERRQMDGLPDFRIQELGPNGRLVAAGQRPVYYPILFAEPPRNEAGQVVTGAGEDAAGSERIGSDRAAGPASIALARPGFDRGSEPAQLAAFALAVETGQHQTSGPFAFLGAAESEPGLDYLTSLPVFAGPGALTSPAERRRSLRGFVLGIFRLESVFDSAGTGLADLPMSAEVSDARTGQVLRPFPDSVSAGTEVVTETLDLGGMRWTLRFMRQTAADPRHVLSWLLLGFGLTVSGLLALHLRGVRERALELARSNRALTHQVLERKAAEVQSREAQRAMKTLLSNLPGMAYRCRNDEDWTVEFVSDGCLPLTGYHPAELQSGPFSFAEIIHEEDRQLVWDGVQESLKERRAFQLVYRIVRKDGETRWVWEQGRGVFDQAGELDVLEGFITDITAQKIAEQSLRKEQSFSEATIDSLPSIFYLFDSGGRYLRWNDNLERVSGYGRAEIAEMHPLQMIAPEERGRVQERISEVFETGDSTVEAHLYTKSGERIPYFFTGRRITLDGKLCLLGMGIDVTERVRAERERQTIQRKVLETQKLESIGLLAGGIAHDFNNLLTTIVGNLRFAGGRLADTSPAREFIDLASQAADRAGTLTQQLLAYTGHATPERLPIDLSDHIRELSHLLTSSLSKKVDLQLVLGEHLPAVEADPAQIQQIAMNLVLNGAEACADRPGVVRVRTEARTIEPGQIRAPQGEPLPPGRYVSLVVEDTGEGMDAATQARIFDPFFTTKFTGRGLGLAAVLGIVRGHGGALEVRSSPGRGSVFEVLLPASGRPSQPRRPSAAQDLSGEGLILVADDEPGVLAVARQALTDCGYEVLEARDGRQAVDLFRHRGAEVDLVLLDMTMPELNGAEALGAIRALRPEVPALLSSGYDEEQTTRQVLGAGLAGFIQKPYTPSALAAKVKEILSQRRLTR